MAVRSETVKAGERREMDKSDVPRITCEDLKQLFDSGEGVVVIDTRDSGSYGRDHIKGAINIYYNPAGDPIERELPFMALPGDRLLVFYCDCMDEADSSIMANELKAQRYDINNIKVLEQGYIRWKELGYPTEESEY
jgi:rhodanese-related sulfurtransferase